MKRILCIWILLCGMFAAEAQSGYGLLIENAGQVTVCNNIVVFNDHNTNDTNAAQNIFQDTTGIFSNDQNDFSLTHQSPAIEAGVGSCCTWQLDLNGHIRVVNVSVDMGAYEYPVEARAPQFAVHQMETGQLVLCNNIIVNNPQHTAMTNVTALPTNNILSDSVSLFLDAAFNFTLWSHSPAVDAGQNSCLALSMDMDSHARVQGEAMDVGAFEFTVDSGIVAAQVYTVYQDSATVSLCNNIIINNSVYTLNTNVQNVAFNIVTDIDTLFTDNNNDYTPRPESGAVNAGDNACNSLEKDLDNRERISGGTIDMGAFELVEEDQNSYGPAYAVHRVGNYSLLLCNNIIVNNPEHEAETNIENVPDNNILSDSIQLFYDPVLMFRLRYGSPAIDAGNNGCSYWATDLDTVPRISNGIIDIGAFEIPEQDIHDTTAAGGGGSGGWYDGNTFTSVVLSSLDTLFLCNNIIINNSFYALNTNVEADSSNIVTDQDSLFTHNRDNYMPRSESEAVNRGENSCNELETDLAGHARIFADTIDIGALEQFTDPDTTGYGPAYAVHIIGNHNLTLCNNIIVNNPEHAAMVNSASVAVNNILSDSIQIFSDAVFSYTLWQHSPAVNAGWNDCCPLALDLRDGDRVVGDTIDVGAFEYYPEAFSADTTSVVMQSTDTATLFMCNNIVINNCAWALNVIASDISNHNIVEDNDTLFEDNVDNYMPRENSIAVDQGNNDCCGLSVDLFKHPRIMADTIDVGAYEQYVIEVVPFVSYPVHQVDSTKTLLLYNNIVIYNPDHTMSTGGHILGDHNLLEDMPDVFVNAENNYSLCQNSPAIDEGDNQWVSWPLDIKDFSRIACANVVDQGAYEYSFSDLETVIHFAEVPTDNCQGYYIELTASSGAQHYYWSHTNEDTNVVQVSPLIPTLYSVIASNGGECLDSASVYVVPSAVLSDSLGAPASMGTVFWLSYLRNHFRTPELTLNVSAAEACAGTVSNPRTGWTLPFTVGAHSVTTVTIPVEQAYPSQSDVVGDFGLLVETTDTVSLYAANYNTSSFDVTDVLPVDALSDEYVIQTYTPTMNAEFVIVATEDSTVVAITPSRALQGGHAALQTFSVTLNQGQTYLGMSQYGGVLGDLSGTVIHSYGNKPVAVFNGNVCALVPTDNSYTDHLVEQAVGVNYWGRSFAITTTESQNFDMVRVTALRNNTEVFRNGALIATLQANQTHEFQITNANGSCYLETSEPSGVYLYIAGAVQGNPLENSDPSMIWIPPTEQMLNDITFATFDSPGIADHYVNIVIPASAVNEVTLDGVPIGSNFALLEGNADYAFARKHIPNGTHILHCDGGFIAHCYGLGFHESYGYAAGSKAVPLTEQLYVNGILNTEMPAGTKFCPYEPITFSTYVNYPCDSVTWNFGDATPVVSGGDAVHAYAEAGTYTVAATLYITNNGTVFCTNLYARVKVVDGPTITLQDTVCMGDVYQQNGFEIAAAEPGPFTYTRTTSAPGQYCDSTFILELYVLNNHFTIQDTICVNNHYTWYGFNITPTEIGIYEDTLHAGLSSNGCDSLLLLSLSVTPNTENPPAIEGEGTPCMGGSYTYSIDSLSGLQEVVWTVPDNVMVLPQQDPYKISLLFDSFEDSLTICVTALGGCGTMNWCRTIFPQPYNFVQISDTLCQGETEYTGYGFTLTGISDTNDLFYHHDVAAGGCDSTTVLSIVFMPTYQVEDTIVICENDYPYLYHDTLLADTGRYVITLASQFGCDSTVILVMGSYPIYHTYFDTTVCDLMDWYGHDYTVSGEYDTLLTSVFGCDSMVTMRLTVHYSDTVAADSSVCRSELPLVWNDVTFSDAGEETAVLTNRYGCDSLVVMTLTVKELTDSTMNVYVLEGNMPCEINDSVYQTDGTYIQHLVNAAGCDSTLTVVLTVLNNVSNTVDSTICDSELPLVWNEVAFGGAGTQFAVLVAANGADSVVVMNLTVIPTEYQTVDTAIVENALSFTFNDSVYHQAGTYTQYLVSAAGCDSILTLNLTVYPNVTVEVDSSVCEALLPISWNDSLFMGSGTKTTVIPASTGADSTVVMTLTMIPTTYGTFDTAVVQNALPFHYNDSVYQEEGIYTQYLWNSLGCDSILTLNLEVYPNVTVNVDSAVCEGNFPFTWNDSVFTEAGVKSTTIFASTGADSTVVMAVTMIPTLYQDVYDTACDSLTWINGVTYYESTDSAVCVLTASSGCDSVVTLHLTMLYTQYAQITDTACDNYTWNDITYAETGNYTQILTAANGCDSVVTLHLTVNYSTTYIDEYTVCDSMTWIDGVTYYESTDTVTYLMTNAVGCDSVITLHLTVNHSTPAIDVITACDSMTWIDGVTYYESNDSATYMLTTVGGCDSLVTLHLTMHYAQYTQFADTACDSYTWNDSIYTESGDHIQVLTGSNGCDSTVTLHLMVKHSTDSALYVTVLENNLPYTLNNLDYTLPGEYPQHFTNAVGCDSTLTLHLTVLYNVTSQVDTTVCVADMPITWYGHAYTTAGSHSVTLTASNGVDSTVTYTLSVDNLAATTGDVTHVVCYGDSTGAATATVTGGTAPLTYQWTQGTGTNLSATNSLNDRPAGNYTFTVTDQVGCVASFTVTINTLNEEMVAGTITADQELCDGEEIAPFGGTAASGGDNGVYQWQISTNGTDWASAPGVHNNQDYIYSDLAENTFTLRRAWVSQSCGTVYSNIVTVGVWPNSSDTVTAEICQGESYEEHGFEISPEQTDIAGEMIFEQHYATGHCDSAIVLLLTVHPTYETELTGVVCEGEGFSVDAFVVTPMETIGTEEVHREMTFQSEFGCDSVVRLTLTVIDTALRIVTLTEDFCDNQSMELMAVTPMPDYVWSTGEQSPNITVTSPGYYSVTATQGDCSATARIRVEACKYELILPNAITPSLGDGVNDCFFIPGALLDNIAMFEISIFNRWGEQVYYSTDKHFRWNGEYRGQIQYQTVYNYIIRYTDTAGRPFVKTGSITVL